MTRYETRTAATYRVSFDPTDRTNPLRDALINESRAPSVPEAVAAHDDVPHNRDVHVSKISVNVDRRLGIVEYWLSDPDGRIITDDEVTDRA